MPITKTAKRALRSSKRKEARNNQRKAELDVAIRQFKKKPTKKAIQKTVSLVDRAAKKNLIHKNKAARIKSKLEKILVQTKSNNK